MRMNDAYPNKWLKAEDLEEDMTFTIRDVRFEEFIDPKTQTADRKPVMFFEEDEDAKPMVLNKTNFKTISQVLRSDDTDNWIGKKITLFATEVEAFGEMTLGIRVRLKAPAKASVPSARSAAAGKSGKQAPRQGQVEAPDADDIPF